MFESFWVRGVYHVLAGISTVLSLLWMYIILKHSPVEMVDFKWILLKLALMEELFSMFLSYILFIDVLFPAEGGAVLGVAKYFGEAGARFAVAATFFFGMFVFVAINDCLIFRTLLFHQKDTLVRTLVTPYIGIPLTVALHGIGCGVPLFVTIYLAFEDPTEFVPRMKALGKYGYIEFYALRNETVWVSMDVKSIYTQIFIYTVVLGLLGIYGIHAGAAFILFRRLSSLQSHLSVASYKVHLTVLYLLVSQNLYPIFVILCPVLYTGIGFSINSTSMLVSDVWKYMAVSGLILYPTVGCMSSMLIMKPYREFMKEKVLGIFGISINKPMVIEISSSSAIRSSSFLDQRRSIVH